MTLDYAKLTVPQIKDMLIEEGRYTEEELADLDVKGKTAWVELHQQTDDISEDGFVFDESMQAGLEALGIIEEGVEPIIQTEEAPEATYGPNYSDPEWSDWVMSQFEPHELTPAGNPLVNGLRRMVSKLLGDIVFSGPVKVDSYNDPDGGPGKSTVLYRVEIEWKRDEYYATQGLNIDTDYPVRTFCAAASSWHGNTDDEFAVFPEAMADTRGEVRCLKRALRIDKVAGEELTSKDTAALLQQQRDKKTTSTATTGEWEEDAFITDAQINTMVTMCNRLGIDLIKFIDSGEQKYDTINDVKKATAAKMLKQLNRYQSAGDGSIEIPEELKKEN